jgi:flagellar biosynthesis/type III secretory pathway M-ring protein FliF/YscJ
MVVTSKAITFEVFQDKCPICEKVFQERYKKSLEINMKRHIKACEEKRIKRINARGIVK